MVIEPMAESRRYRIGVEGGDLRSPVPAPGCGGLIVTVQV
jgi:hypothetical protein